MTRRPQADEARRLSVQQTASRVLIEAASLDEAMAEILQAVATELEWALAIYWVVTADTPTTRPSLQCRAIWADEAVLRTPPYQTGHWGLLIVDGKTGETTNWGAEMGPPHGLQRRGWRQNTLKIGDQVTVAGSLAKNGAKRMNASKVTLASTGLRPGETLDAASSGSNNVDQ